MAQRIQVLLVCDLHDDETPGTETITFTLDGASYEIDLCEQHAVKMRERFATYIGAGRRAGGRGDVAGGAGGRAVGEAWRAAEAGADAAGAAPATQRGSASGPARRASPSPNAGACRPS